jgi:hypothetical protein
MTPKGAARTQEPSDTRWPCAWPILNFRMLRNGVTEGKGCVFTPASATCTTVLAGTMR